MAWSVRPLSEGSARIRAAFRQYLPGSDSALKNNFLTVLVKVLAMMSQEFELRMAWTWKQFFLETCDADFVPVRAAEVGIFAKPAATAAGTINGMGTSGVTYPAGVSFTSGSVRYVSSAAATAGPGGAVSFAVAAVLAGSEGNRDAGSPIALSDPVLYPDLSVTFTVASGGIGGGADIENVESLRARALYRKRNPPGAGRLSDFEAIALSVPGVVKAWAARPTGAPGFLVVYFLFSGRTNLIPAAGDVAAVQAAIDAARMIRLDDSVAVAPIAAPVNITITGLDPDRDDVRAAIAANLTAMFKERADPRGGLVVRRSWISEAISAAAGENSHILTQPAVDPTFSAGQYPVLGTVTYAA